MFRERPELGSVKVRGPHPRRPSPCLLEIRRSFSIRGACMFSRRRRPGLAVSPLEKRRADSAPEAEWPKIPQSHFFSVLLFLFVASSVWAVDPHTLISQYGHTALRTQDGFVNRPSAFTQTADGY